MSENSSQSPLDCGCGCACPLNEDPKQVREKEIDGSKVIMNLSCYIAAYGEDSEVSNEYLPEQKICPCGCGKPLSRDHLRGVKYVHLHNGDPALVNIECASKFDSGIIPDIV